MTDKDFETDDLSLYFDAAKEVPPTPPNALMRRVLDDALAAQPGEVRTSRQSFWVRRWQEFAGAVGGWPAMAGLATATVAGVWLGVAPPAILPDATGAYLATDANTYLVDVAPDLGFDLFEEAL